MAACASELAGTSAALAVVPSGTGNLLAANLGLPARPADAVLAATAGGRRRIDVGMAGDHCFTVMAGMKIDAQMVRDTPETLKARLGWPAYLIAAARHLCETPMRVSISLDQRPAVHPAGQQPTTTGARSRCAMTGSAGPSPGWKPAA